jgi:hypothetical protein
MDRAVLMFGRLRCAITRPLGARVASDAVNLVWIAIVALFASSCLLTTSLDGLEGPPLEPDAGAGGASGTGGGGGAGGSGGVSDAGAIDAPLTDAAADGSAKGPFAVAPTGAVVLGIAEHGGDVFWVQGDTGAGIVRAPKLGGGSSYVQVTPDAFDVAVDDNDVYWSTGSGNQVFKKRLGSDASASELVFSGAGQTLYLAAGSGARLYATGNDTIAVGPHADAGTSDALYLSRIGAAGIAVSGANLFWSDDTGIVRGADDGQTMQSIYRAGPGEIRGIATDGQDVYWMARDGALRAISLTDPGAGPPREVCRTDPETAMDGGPRAAADVAVDDQWVYFAEPAKRRISKCLKR